MWIFFDRHVAWLACKRTLKDPAGSGPEVPFLPRVLVPTVAAEIPVGIPGGGGVCSRSVRLSSWELVNLCIVCSALCVFFLWGGGGVAVAKSSLCIFKKPLQ